MWNHKRLQIAKAVLKTKNKAEDTLPDFRLHYNTIVMKKKKKKSGTDIKTDAEINGTE